MINFVLKPQLLPITKTTNVHHFYQFQAKQMKQKQLEEKRKLDDFMQRIKQEQQKQQLQKSDKKQLNFTQQHHSKQMPKSFSEEANYTLNKNKTKPNTTKSFNEFYQKNKKWKQNVQAQILKRKQEKIKQQEMQLTEYRKPLSEKQSFSNSMSKNSQSLQHAFDSKGPISGWTQRFHDYIKKRLPQQPQQDFRPTINKKSQIIASRMVGKVQDRLIRFGQILKIRKHQTMLEQVQKIGKLPNSENHMISTNTNKSDFFHRLYKESQVTARRRKDQTQDYDYSFRPSISKISENMEKKVQQKRSKSPLFSSKKFSKQETQRLLELYTKETGKVYTEGDFKNFMRRNELLLQRKSKNLELKVKQDRLKEQKQFQQCTFIPLVNPKSIKLFDKSEQRQVQEKQSYDFEYSQEDFRLEQNPDNLFNQQQSKHVLKSNSKYSYIHSYNNSYTEGNDFEYEIKTPGTEKYQIENTFEMKSPAKNKLNEPSEMDSLEFSAQKRSINKFEKNVKKIVHKPNQIPVQIISDTFQQDEDQLVNYELTFSNRKLQHQLSEAKKQLSEQEHCQMPSQAKELNSEKHEHKSSKNESEQKQKLQRLQNSWQSELQKVKNRLQNLMKSSGKKP